MILIAVTTMLRGMVGEEIELSCTNRDLHSGMFGNAARNLLQVLADIVSSLRTPDGVVAIAGFYDGTPDCSVSFKDHGLSPATIMPLDKPVPA
ncbi:Putative peptidase [Rhizobium freirei PRF 81]|uniref:Putative peptidase n=1 Tax=Rhizobium freirei PRF 81 TaxID=363754 RepID=N6V1J8_9HYPH|nr:Putative peptidase [Rhizobium freirei PRF 81]